MDFSSLKCFVTIVDTGSFSAAASQLFLSQPTLSGKVKRLEEELGVQLLNRTTRHIALTECGKKLYRHAVLILEEEQRMLQDMGIPQGGLAGHLEIWYSPMVAREITGLFAHLTRVFPKVVIQCSQDDSIDIHFSADTQYDLAFLPGGNMEFDQHLNSMCIMESQYCAVLPVTHRLAGRNTVSIHDLKGLTLLQIGTPGMKNMETSMLSALRSGGGAPKEIQYSRNHSSLEVMVSTGIGYAILPSNMAVYAPKDLCYIPINDFPINSDRLCFWREDNPNPILPAVLREISVWKKELNGSSEPSTAIGHSVISPVL